MAKLLDTEINGNLNLNGENVNTFMTETKNIFTNFVNTKTGTNVVTIDDISPIKHEMNVNIRSKNLLNIERELSFPTDNGFFVDCNIPSPFVFSMTFNITAPVTAAGGAIFQLTYDDGTVTSVAATSWNFQNLTGVITKTMPVTNGKTLVKVSFPNWCNLTGTIYDMQIESGTTATEYTPYIDVNGAEVKRYSNLFNPTEIEQKYNGSVTTEGDIITSTTTNAALNWGSSQVFKAGKYTISVFPETTPLTLALYFYDAATGPSTAALVTKYLNNASEKTSFTFEVKKDFIVGCGAYNGVYGTSSYKIMLTGEAIHNEFVSYKEPTTYTADENGIVNDVISLYPTTTLISDNCIIQAQYNRDLNKAFEELTTAILSLGGNV